MSCENAKGLVPSYLDGELTEEQAAPLRTHLFACPACREVAKEEKVLKRWFAPGRALAREVQVPQGFAARVARRAFAGDPGILTPPLAAAAEGPQALPASEFDAQEPAAALPGTLQPFLLKFTAAAAAILFVFAIVIQNQSLPSGSGLEAQYQPPWEKEAYDLPGASEPLQALHGSPRPEEGEGSDQEGSEAAPDDER